MASTCVWTRIDTLVHVDKRTQLQTNSSRIFNVLNLYFQGQSFENVVFRYWYNLDPRKRFRRIFWPSWIFHRRPSEADCRRKCLARVINPPPPHRPPGSWLSLQVSVRRWSMPLPTRKCNFVVCIYLCWSYWEQLNIINMQDVWTNVENKEFFGI